jgi:hypothetical protein
VDSAEADKVGSRGFRFCAYAGCALYQGVRHRRTTSVRFIVLLQYFCDICGRGLPLAVSQMVF